MKRISLVTLLLFCKLVFSQSYTYRDFLQDKTLEDKLEDYLIAKKIDSLKLSVNTYKNRLGFPYFKYKAIIANHDSDIIQKKYIDSSFMKGMTPVCLESYLKKFDSLTLYSSFKNNYLKSYNLQLITLIDSIYERDQQYRRLMALEYKNKKEPTPSNSQNNLDGNKRIELQRPSQQQVIDSLWKLQRPADSLNLIKLNEVLDKFGWPGAKLVGERYCQRRAPDITFLFIHLGNTRREFQISNLKKVIALCYKHEESWQNAESLITGIHSKFSKDYSEFSFLDIKNNHLNVEGSFFSVYNMAKMLKNSNSIIEIKCSKISLFNELKNEIISISKLIAINPMMEKTRKDLGLPPLKKFDESSILFVESPDLKDNIVLYKISKK